MFEPGERSLPCLPWLVKDFISHRYDMKHLIKKIMTSAVYARSSFANRRATKATRNSLSHYRVKRLPAEVLLDAIARITDVPYAICGLSRGLA